MGSGWLETVQALLESGEYLHQPAREKQEREVLSNPGNSHLAARDSAGVRTEPVPTGSNEQSCNRRRGHRQGVDYQEGTGDNIAAIKILKALDAEGRVATPTSASNRQVRRLGRTKGPFDPGNKQWSKQHAELKELRPKPSSRPRAPVHTDAHWHQPHCRWRAMYDAMGRLGFTRAALEPLLGPVTLA